MPYWRLSGFYFFYFASLGLLLPYWGLYLQWKGFSALEIGEFTAILLVTRVIAPNIWSWIADHRGQRMKIVRLGTFMSALVFSAVLFGDSYLWMAGVMFLFSFFWNATLPQFEVTTLQHLGEHSHHYSKIRIWGSVGFIAIVVVLGVLLEHFDADIIPYTMLISLSAIWLISLSVPESSPSYLSLAHQPIMSIIKRREVT